MAKEHILSLDKYDLYGFATIVALASTQHLSSPTDSESIAVWPDG